MKYRVILYIFSLLICFSCDDFLEENPEDFLSPENMPQTEDDCELMLNGVVGRLVETSSNGLASYLYDWQLLKLAELSVDEMIETGSSGADYQLDSYTYMSDNKHIYGTWAQLYRIINDANTMITKIPDADLDDAVIEKYVAAAKFLRALSYYHLVNLYGDNAILIEEPVSDFSEVLSVSSSTVAEIYSLIESDAEYAVGQNTEGENRLPTDEWDEAGRPTYGAAKALQASVCLSMAGYPLYMGDDYWTKARDAASVVMGISNYSLHEDVETLFSMDNDNGPEFIFSAQYYLPNYGSMMAAQTRPDAWKSVKASEDFLNTFSANDLRRSNYLIIEWNGNPYTSLSGKVPYVGKWKDIGRDVLSDYNKRTALNNPIFRMSEMYLIYAEAENELNGPTNAYDELNAIRTRAGLEAISGLTQDEFRDSLKMERHHELCFEYKRRYDLIRWDDFEEAMENDPEVSSEFNVEEHRYYPVPNHEVLLNESLE